MQALGVRGFSRPGAAGARPGGDSGRGFWREDRISQALRCFSGQDLGAHGESLVQAPGKASVAVASLCLDWVWLGGAWLPISDLQHVPSCVTFSSFHVAVQSPVMGSAEATALPTASWRRGPSGAGSLVPATWP